MQRVTTAHTNATRVLARSLQPRGSRFSNKAAPPNADASETGLEAVRPFRSKTRRGLVTMEDAKRWKDMSPKERVVFATKQTSYVGVSAFGLGATAVVMYMVLGELFSPNQASAVYSRALAEIQQNQRVKELLGEPVCGYRENDRRGHWKRFDVYDSANGDASGKTAYMRFGVSGPISEGTANAWLHQGAKGKWEFTHLNVEIPRRGLPPLRAVVVDSRASHDQVLPHVEEGTEVTLS